MKNLMIFFVFVIAISTIEYSFADLQSDTDTYLEKGIVLLQGGDTDTALKYFNAVLDIDSENVDALYYKSKILTKLEQKQDATSIIEKILGIDIVHVGALGLKADELLKNGKFDEALIIYEDILEVEPNHARAQSALGDSLLEKGDDVSLRGALGDEAISFPATDCFASLAMTCTATFQTPSMQKHTVISSLLCE